MNGNGNHEPRICTRLIDPRFADQNRRNSSRTSEGINQAVENYHQLLAGLRLSLAMIDHVTLHRSEMIALINGVAKKAKANEPINAEAVVQILLDDARGEEKDGNLFSLFTKIFAPLNAEHAAALTEQIADASQPAPVDATAPTAK